jgi:hypothetical protein
MEWEQMWILIVTAWVAGDPPHARFFPTIFAQEFSSESKCLTAKSFIDEKVVGRAEELNDLIRARAEAGQFQAFERIYVDTRCTEK